MWCALGALAREAVEVATSLAKTYDSEIRLISIINPIVPVSPMDVVPQAYYESLGTYEHLELEKIAAKVDRPKEKVSTALREGGTYPELLAAADEWKAELIIIGAHKRSMASYLLGSTAAAVVRHATCPVLVLRSAKKASIL